MVRIAELLCTQICFALQLFTPEHIEHIEPNHSDYEATEDQDNHGNQSNHGNSAGWTSGTGMVG